MTLKATLQKVLDSLPEDRQREVLDFARSLGQTKPAGVRWEDLRRFAGTIDKDELRQMADAIEQGCERIDANEW